MKRKDRNEERRFWKKERKKEKCERKDLGCHLRSRPNTKEKLKIHMGVGGKIKGIKRE